MSGNPVKQRITPRTAWMIGFDLAATGKYQGLPLTGYQKRQVKLREPEAFASGFRHGKTAKAASLPKGTKG
jgi:hypothetical protein